MEVKHTQRRQLSFSQATTFGVVASPHRGSDRSDDERPPAAAASSRGFTGRLQPYAVRVLWIAVLVGAVLVGYLARRWAVLLLGPAAALAVLGVAVFQQRSFWDTPAVFLAVTVTAALAVGVTRGRVNQIGRGSAEF